MTRLGRIFRCQRIHMIPVQLQTASKFCNGLLRNVTFYSLYPVLLWHIVLSSALWLPWQIFWQFKILAWYWWQLRSVTFAYSTPMVVSCSSPFLHGGLTHDCRGHWEYRINVALEFIFMCSIKYWLSQKKLLYTRSVTKDPNKTLLHYCIFMIACCKLRQPT